MKVGLRLRKARRPAMAKLALRSALANKLRLLLTLMAVLVGTGFISGSLLLTHSLDRSFDSLLDAGVEGVDIGMVGNQNRLTQGIPFSVVQEIASRPDVRAVNITGDGNSTPSGTQRIGQSALVVTNSQGTPIQAGSSGAHPFAVYPSGSYVGPEPQIIEGRVPTGDNEIMLNEQAAARGNINIGDTITVVTVKGQLTVTVAGIFSSPSDTTGWIGVGFPLQRYLELFTDGNNVTQIVIAAADGTSAMDLRNALGAKYRSYTVLTASQISDRLAGNYRQQLGFMTYMLAAFGLIALIIGSFLVTNTFSMTLNQRSREFALLRSIGVYGRQIQFSVIMEALLIGLIGSVLGITLGIAGVTAGVTAINELGNGLTSINLELNSTIIIVPLIVGILITVLAVTGPLMGIAKLLPIDALRVQHRDEAGLRLRTTLGTILLTVSVVIGVLSNFVTAINDVNLSTDQRLGILACSTISALIAISLIGPAWSRVFMILVSPIAALFGGLIGKLANRNAIRNPRRTATTAMALILGVGLIGCVGVIGTTTKQSVYGIISSQVSADYVLDSIGGSSVGTITSESNTGAMTIPTEAISAVQSTRGVADELTVMVAAFTINGWSHDFAVIDNNLPDFIDVGLRSGTNDLKENPGILISAQYAKDANLQVGSTVVLRKYNSYDGIRVRVQGIYSDYSYFGHIIIDSSTAKQVESNDDAYQIRNIFIRSDGSVSDSALRSNLESSVAQFLIIQVKNRAEFKDALGTQVNQMLTIVYCLIVLAVIVAALGIMNTLFLSVSERTREIGMLRAIGFERRHIRRMIHIESLQIAIQGTIIGMIVGIFSGWGIVHLLGEKGMGSANFPWVMISSMSIGAVFLTGLAAAIPAWRASHTPPLEAIANEH